jgi:glycosidase
VIIANPYQARILSEKINVVRRAEGKLNQQVTPGQVNGLGLLHEIIHFMIRYYEEKENPGVFTRSVTYLKSKFGDNLDKVLNEFVNEFPTLDVYKNKISAEEYINGSTGTKSNKEIILEEIILLSIENINPATIQLKELYDDSPLANKTEYKNLITETEKFFEKEKPIASLPLITFLRTPILSSPDSILGQFDYILRQWGVYVLDKFGNRLLSGKDLINEDSKLFMHFGGGEKGTPPVPTYEFDWEYFEMLKAKLAAGLKLTDDESRFYHAETEQFTADIDWMPKVVMIAKNVYVWLFQLSKKYQRTINRLDQIPDEELDILARWNFNSLWLIGIWERSSASKKIKIFTGNPEAAASAYSLYDYVIASELGGEDAFLNLKHRSWERGIRLASDMVPNHTGIYSKWVTEKPDYFIQTSQPPYPSYQFNGPNLSDDDRVHVRIEDKYYSRSDAAVVFQRVDTWSGDVRYIYHGNDGTNMPWNDTAQLNLLNPEVRESLIQTIMHVARKTSIIRFDAAMTLAKKHFQRLWFPEPGLGGAVPSRSDHALTRSEFDKAMPVEFWREVVDRINAEMPNTLLLAEAFWLMEGYFVRTLGMHRVYNSAFMHMLMKEENEKYKLLIKNTLEFNPEILKRYVNFMSNPDEETAVNQFGKGDKFFGVTVLMCTLPGLPMFAHGQIEGYSEKYGMEYKRSYYDEFIDDHLVWRHEREIFPLSQKRYIFSQVYNFELYDLIDDFGNINDNVFAYSNNVDGERSLIIFNNSYASCKGTINYSSNKINSSGGLSNKKLGDALGMRGEPNFYYIYRDYSTNLEYIRSAHDVFDSGLYVVLGGYQYNAFLEFREVYDHTGSFYKLCNFLNGRGVPSIEEAKNELHLSGVHASLRKLLSPYNLDRFESLLTSDKLDNKEIKQAYIDLEGDINYFVNELNNIKHIPIDNKEIVKKVEEDIKASQLFLFTLNGTDNQKKTPIWFTDAKSSVTILGENGKSVNRNLLLLLIILRNISQHNIDDLPGYGNLFNRLMMDRILQEVLENKGIQHTELSSILFLSRALLKVIKIDYKSPSSMFEEIADQHETAEYIGLHDYQGTRYFNKENFDLFMDWQLTFAAINSAKQEQVKVSVSKVKYSKENNITDKFKTLSEYYSRLKTAAEKAKYKFDDLILSVEEKPSKQGTVKSKPLVNLKAQVKKKSELPKVVKTKTVTPPKASAKKKTTVKKATSIKSKVTTRPANKKKNK